MTTTEHPILKNKITTPEQAVELIRDGDTVCIGGSGGGIAEPSLLIAALETRFLKMGSPRNLTFVHVTGVGDKQEGGMSRLAHLGLVKRNIGGHWDYLPKMRQLAIENKIEAYNLPQGVLSQLFREIASGRPGLITHVGLMTFVDPRLEGGRLNDVTQEQIVRVIEIDGQEKLFYQSFPINVAMIRGTTADEDGNITMEHEAAILEMLSMAQAARNSGGVVLAQVKRMARQGSLDPRLVKVPGILVDKIVISPEQRQSCEEEFNPAFCGEVKAALAFLPKLPLNIRKVIARRVAIELSPGAVVNLGVGMPDGVASVAAEENISEEITFALEHGIIGGIPARGLNFGAATNPQAIIDASSQFDFFHGGGLDIAILGLAQADKAGNVNVSKFGQIIAGCGGFIDISQNAKKIIFCGTFTASGLQADTSGSRLRIVHEGKIKKFVNQVEQITFSGSYALAQRQRVLYVTERAVFRLTNDGLQLLEVAPGLDIRTHILSQLEFQPIIIEDELKQMSPEIFSPQPMGLMGFLTNSHDEIEGDKR